MFRHTFQSGFLSIFYSLGSKPLQLWATTADDDGSIKKVRDEDVQSVVLEIVATNTANIARTFIACPADTAKTLGIKLPFFVMIAKNLGRYFSFEVEVLDDQGERRRFRSSNFQTTTRLKDYICTMPMHLEDGWNQIQLNLAELTKKAYGTNYTETCIVTVHANCRLRRIYFADRLYSEDELPTEFKLFLPIQRD